MIEEYKKIDSKELKFKDTVFIRDIDTRVFQAIVLKCLASIEGIALIEGTFIDHLLGREGVERSNGIFVEQDSKSHSVSIKVELYVGYGIPIPMKSEEIQSKVVEDVTKLTGLHVAAVHIVFKNLIPEEDLEKILTKQMGEKTEESQEEFFNEFSEEF